MTVQAETQPERTRLAWQRTAMALLGVCGLLGHAALRGYGVRAAVLAAVVALVALATGAFGRRRYRRALEAVRTGSDVRAPRAAGVTVAVVVLVAAAVLAEVLVHETGA